MPLALAVKILRSAHTVHLCVLCGSENKQPLRISLFLNGFYNRERRALTEFLNTVETKVKF